MTLTREQIAGLRELLAKATPGEWMLATSCSWRRILTTGGKPVIVPTIQRSDNHPDMECGEDYINAEVAIAAVNALPALLDIAEAVANADKGTACRDACGMGTIILPDGEGPQVRQRVRILPLADEVSDG